MPFRRLMLRVLVALVTSAALLHLTLEGGGVICSPDAAGRVHAGSAPSQTGSHAGHGAPAASMTHQHSDAAQQGSGQRAPAQERCCDSMSSCGVTTVASVIDHVSTPSPASRIPAGADVMVASLRPAPEPPPPKA